MDLELVQYAEQQFFEWVEEAFRHQGAGSSQTMQIYLTLLLEKFLYPDQAEVLNEPLLWELNKAVFDARGVSLAGVKKVGDAALFTAGIIAPYFRKTMGRKHYIRTAEGAYEILGYNESRRSELMAAYHCLAVNASPYARVLEEFGREHIFRTKLETVLSVYERYLVTGKREEDRKWLEERGVVLFQENKRLII